MRSRNVLSVLRAAGGLLSLVCAPAALAASSHLTPAPGYSAQDSFTASGLGGGGFATGFDGVSLLGWSSYGSLIYQDASGGPALDFGAPGGGYSGFNTFVRYSADYQTALVGFSTIGNVDDRIYEVNLASKSWAHIGTFAGHGSAVYRGSEILITGTNSTGFGGSNGLWLLDSDGGQNHERIVNLGGFAAGLDVDASGNVYVLTAFAASDGLRYLDGADFENFFLTGELTPGDAAFLAGFGGDTGAGVDVGADGNVYYTTSGGSARLWRYDPTTGTTTLLGERDGDTFGDPFPYLGAVAAGNGVVYTAAYGVNGVVGVSAVPEPGAGLLLLIAGGGLAIIRLRRGSRAGGALCQP